MRLMLEAAIDEGETAPAKTVANSAPVPTIEADDHYDSAPVVTAGSSKNADAVPTVAASLDVEDPQLYSSVTLSDAEQFASPVRLPHTSAIHGPVTQQRRKRSRRTFLLAAGTVLGVSGIGVGSALAYRMYFSAPTRTTTSSGGMAPTTTKTVTTQTKPTSQPMKPGAKGLLTFQRHQQLVRSVVWSPDGKFLASGGDDKHVFIWDTTGAVRQDLVHPAGVFSLALSPDGQRIVTAADTQVAFYQTTNGNLLFRSQHSHTQQVTGVAWSSHGPMDVVSVSADKSALVWNPTNFKVVQAFHGHQIAIEAVSWSADGLVVATGSNGGVVHVWNAATAQDIHGFYSDAALPMRAVAFAPTGNMLAVGGDDGIVRIWNGLTCTLNGTQCKDVPQRFTITTAAIRALAWSPDGQYLAVGTNDGLTVLLKPGSGTKPIFTANAHTNVRSLTWSPDGQKLAVAYGNLVSIWTMQGL
jgi:WD40 repeat protein